MMRGLSWIVHMVVCVAFAALIATALGIEFLDSSNWPTGGDAASHSLYAWLYASDLLWSGQWLPWVPEVFGGLPFLSYYFPLPFVVIALLAKVIGFAPAFKWGSFLAAMVLPGVVFSASRGWLKFSWQASLFAALGAFACLMHEQNSIWGGNLLSGLAGEFAYSYGMLFGVAAMLAWSRAILQGRGWLTAALFEAASGFSHGFPLLVVGFSTVFFLLDSGAGWDFRRARKSFGLLLRGHLFAFCLLGGWLWPMLEMHWLTIPNDTPFVLNSWQELLPKTLWPVVLMGVIGIGSLAWPVVRVAWAQEQAFPIRYLASGAALAALAFVVGDRMGLANIRFFPMVWVLGAIVCGWLFGQSLSLLRMPAFSRWSLTAAICLGLVGWIGSQVKAAPDWALWNHSGLDAKPQWHVLSSLFPQMKGDLWSPRLLFEHDPANDDIGSTRTLEALPLFLNHRPVLEGLYMESALIAPAVYQVQSEVSATPSSPATRFPSGSLDPESAARHMNALHADTLLLRSNKAKAAIEASGLFQPIATAPPFSLYRLKRFDSQLAVVVSKPLRWLPTNDWMKHSFDWFRTRARFESWQPVYDDHPPAAAVQEARPGDNVTIKQLSRNELVFITNAPHRPHLIKIAYHPRWQLVSGGSLHIAAPGFMLVIPDGNEIHLVYGHTLIGRLGVAATFSMLICLAWLVRRRAPTDDIQETTASGKYRWVPIAASWGALAVCGYYYATHPVDQINRAAPTAFVVHYVD